MGLEKDQIITSYNYSFYHPIVDKEPVGAIEVGKEIKIALSFPSNYQVWYVQLIIEDDNKDIVNIYSLEAIDNNKYQINSKTD